MSERLQTISDWVDWAQAKLDDAGLYFGHGCDNARDEAIWAVLHTTGCMHRDFAEVAEEPVCEQHCADLRKLIQQRVEQHKPLAYLIGEAWFAGHSYYIDERAIIPRSHFGDLIQDGFSPWLDPHKMNHALDLCCGSGCIGIALALTYPQLKVDVADVDQNALEVSKINIDRFQLHQRVRTIESDLFAALDKVPYDLIVCNPPYVNQSILASLPTEYAYEPQQAFAGGSDGLDLVRKILVEATNYLAPNGYLLIELGDSAQVLEKAIPDVPFLWLTSWRGQSVVLLMSCEELKVYRDLLAAT